MVYRDCPSQINVYIHLVHVYVHTMLDNKPKRICKNEHRCYVYGQRAGEIEDWTVRKGELHDLSLKEKDVIGEFIIAMSSTKAKG